MHTLVLKLKEVVFKPQRLGFTLLAFLMYIGFATGQEQLFKNINASYQQHIKSIQMINQDGDIVTTPILTLNNVSQFFILQFDDLLETEDAKDYFYRITYCNKDWQSTTVNDSEFLYGFNDLPMRSYEFSINTKVDFTQYWISLPSRDVKFRISGNYMLYIYQKINDEEIPILSRRFLVSENSVRSSAQILRSPYSDTKLTHQLLSASTNVNDIYLKNPLRDINATIIKNSDWNFAYTDIKPYNITPNVIQFDFSSKLIFEGGTEYRYFDTRTLRSRGFGVDSVVYNKPIPEVYLTTTKPRAHGFYFFDQDFNGKFYINNADDFFNGGAANVDSISRKEQFRLKYFLQDGITTFKDKDLRSDYAEVHFSLKTQNSYDGDVYVYGALSDWQIKPEYKLEYNLQTGAYEGKILAKQGYYDYLYAIAKKNNIDVATINGSSYETENEYTILVYLSEFGSRYDRLISHKYINSRN